MSKLKKIHYISITLITSLSLLFGYAYFFSIDQFSRAEGVITTKARTQKVQSISDGVIEKVHVNEGDVVEKNQLLVSLENSQTKAALEDSYSKVAALKASIARLEAEVFNREINFPNEIKEFSDFIDNQTELFQLRKNALQQELASLNKSLSLVRKQLSMSRPLLTSGDISKMDIITLEKQEAEIEGVITNKKNKFFSDAQTELTKYQEELATQESIMIDRKTNYERMSIFSPSNGVVKNIEIMTPNARVRASDLILEIMPTGSDIIFEAKVKPSDIAYIEKGLTALVNIDSYDYTTYGKFKGTVKYISPDALLEKTSSGDRLYYRVNIVLDKKNKEGDNGSSFNIYPGMTGTADIKTGERSILKYLVKPIVKTVDNAFGER